MYRRRLRWLLVCGVLHGVLIWFGDILTVYAIAGFWILTGLANARLTKVRTHLRVWACVFFALLLVNFFLGMWMIHSSDLLEQGKNAAYAVESSRAIYTYGNFFSIGMQRLRDYVSVTTQSLFILPHIAVLFLLGVMSVRRGWLTQPERHATFWRRTQWIGFAIGIPFNLAWAALVLSEAIDPLHPSIYSFLMLSLIHI